MRKIRIGIVGLGNLGRACIKILEERQDQFELVAVFSRRMINGCIPIADINNYKDKIDVLLVCVGSQTDAPLMIPELSQKFSIVDTFDTHAELGKYIKSIKIVQEQSGSNKVAIVATGWDPGIFSVMRIYFDAIFQGMGTETFWGKGVSLGHTNAIKAIGGVRDAIQFTVPNKDAVKSVRNGQRVEIYQKHKRVCHVVASINEHERIEREIMEMPNYFKGYETEIHFVEQRDFNRRFKSKTEHGGMVISGDKMSKVEFKAKMKNNANFTASIMIAYAVANYRLQQEGFGGVFTVADIAPKYLCLDDVLDKI